MKRIAVLLALLVLSIASVAQCVEVGTVSCVGPYTETYNFEGKQYRADEYYCDCTAHTDGTFSGDTGIVLKGIMAQVEFFPDSGDTQPTTLFDITGPATLTRTVSGVAVTYTVTDAFLGVGANLSESTSTTRTPFNTDGFIKIMNGETVVVTGSGLGESNGVLVKITMIP